MENKKKTIHDTVSLEYQADEKRRAQIKDEVWQRLHEQHRGTPSSKSKKNNPFKWGLASAAAVIIACLTWFNFSPTGNRTNGKNTFTEVQSAQNIRPLKNIRNTLYKTSTDFSAKITEKKDTSVIRLEQGSIHLSIRARLLKPLQIITPDSVVTVRGTTFSVMVNSYGTSIKVLEGAVEVKDRKSSEKDSLVLKDMTDYHTGTVTGLSSENKKDLTELYVQAEKTFASDATLASEKIIPDKPEIKKERSLLTHIITLKNGKKLKGRIFSENSEFVELKTGTRIIKIEKSKLSVIETVK